MTDADALEAVQTFLAGGASEVPQAAIARVHTLAVASIALAKTLEDREKELGELRRMLDPTAFREKAD